MKLTMGLKHVVIIAKSFIDVHPGLFLQRRRDWRVQGRNGRRQRYGGREGSHLHPHVLLDVQQILNTIHVSEKCFMP